MMLQVNGESLTKLNTSDDTKLKFNFAKQPLTCPGSALVTNYSKAITFAVEDLA